MYQWNKTTKQLETEISQFDLQIVEVNQEITHLKELRNEQEFLYQFSKSETQTCVHEEVYVTRLEVSAGC